jgi:hypothetical protein
VALVGTREINNVEVEIHASKHGSWTIQLPADEGGQHGRALGTHNTSLDAAINLARAEIKRRQVKVDVPFKTREGKKGIAHSRHARSTDKILVVIDGKKDQIGWREQVFKADMPKEVLDHLHDIQDEQSKLKAEEREIVKEWNFDLSKALDEAITKKAEEQK